MSRRSAQLIVIKTLDPQIGQGLKSKHTIVFKAYTATNGLVQSKPIDIRDHSRIVDIYLDMHKLGVKCYYVRRNGVSEKFFLKDPENVHASTVGSLMNRAKTCAQLIGLS